MKILKKTTALVLAIMLFAVGCGKKINPEEYIADHGISLTANGAYSLNGESLKLESVTDEDDGYKRFVFVCDRVSRVKDLYIISKKAGAKVDVIELSGIDGKDFLMADFDDVKKLVKSYGFSLVEENDGKHIVSLGDAKKVLYFVQNGKIDNDILTASGIREDTNFMRLSLRVKYDWSADDFDDLFYIGFNELGE